MITLIGLTMNYIGLTHIGLTMNSLQLQKSEPSPVVPKLWYAYH